MNNKMKRVCYLLVVIFSFCNCNAVNNINDYRTRFNSYFSEIDGFYNRTSDVNYFSKSEFLNKLYLDNNECQIFDFFITNTNATNGFTGFWNDKELKKLFQ